MSKKKTLSVGQIISMVKKEAEAKRTSAGYSGAMHDGGAGRLEDQIKWFQAGVSYQITGDLPEPWQKYQKAEDDEYEEYNRLKEKFEQS